MTPEEIRRGIEAMQRIQQGNPPESAEWKRASRILHELIKRLTGEYPKEARG